MKHWLAVICLLGFLSGEVFTMYASISIGSEGLNSMVASLKSVGSVMNTYYKNLNNARNKVIPPLNSFVEYVNTTYKTLNETYGATQPTLVTMMPSLKWLGNAASSREQQFKYSLGYDLSQQNQEFEQTMLHILQTYNSLLTSVAYQQNAESCTEQIAAEADTVPDQLAKFGKCLQAEVDAVPTMVTPLLNIFKLVKSDFISLNKQLKICAATSDNCITLYFDHALMELNIITMELTMADSLLNNYQNSFTERNRLCAELVKYNVQDMTQNLIQKFSKCTYPPMS